MSNNLIFIISTIGIFLFIRYCFFQGRRWLQAAIVVNLILISVFGAKLITIFGLVTNVGNIFYVMVFFAGQLLVDHYGKAEARRSVWLGLASVAFFVLVGQLTVRYVSTPESAQISTALDTLFRSTPRLAFASLLAYVCAQSLNISVYSYFRSNATTPLWMRSLYATLAGQALDSIVFFFVAFVGVIPQETLIQAMVTGFWVKSMLGAMTIPFLYLSYTVKTRREILEQEAEAILLGVGDGLVMVDRNGKIIVVNRAFETMLGWKSKEVMGKPMTDVITRYDESGATIPFKERILTKVLRGQKVVTTSTEQSYFARKDGIKFPVRIIVAPVLIDNVIMGAVEVFQDISKEKQIERLRSDFLALAAHQLRTPLAGTRWIIETLKGEVLGKLNEKQHEYVSNLSEINTRLIQLVSDLLNVLRLESGSQVTIVKEAFPFSRLFDEVTVTLQPAAKAKNISLVNGAQNQSHLVVKTDFNMTRSIIAAFISNALSYSPPGETIVVDSTETDHEFIFSVKDHGIGIPHDEQPRIFERFYRASNANSMKTDGTGLGLYIASVLAQKIGAKITFESVQDKGSTFYLHIPKES